MICPFCSYETQKTLNKRSTNHASSNWRRRKCLNCNNIFTTYEVISLSYIKVIKKSGEIRVFNRSKLLSGILLAYRNIKHMDSGDAAVFAEEVTKKIENYLISNQVKKVRTTELVVIACQVLKSSNYTAMINYLNYFVKPKNLKAMQKYL